MFNELAEIIKDMQDEANKTGRAQTREIPAGEAEVLSRDGRVIGWLTFQGMTITVEPVPPGEETV